MNIKIRVAFFSILCAAAAGIIGFVFWKNELKYLLPTPTPKSYTPVFIGEKVAIFNLVAKTGHPILLHFFNPECPCSRFNIKEFKRLTQEHSDSIDFYLVLQNTDKDYDFNDDYDLKIPVFNDADGKIADLCGVYSTPQVVIINPDGVIYYKGNYNKSRYCDNKKTRFADIALNSMLAGQPLPSMSGEAALPYGCSLPSDEEEVLDTVKESPGRLY